MFPHFLKTPWFTIYAYGTMLALGYGLATFLTVRRAAARGWDTEWLQNLIIKMLIWGVVGARVFHVIFEWGRYSGNFSGMFRLQDGGLSILGGVMGGAFIVLWDTWSSKVPFWKFADLITPGFALALCFGRLGCFLNGCCHGVETTLPWGVCFPGLGGPRHPTQLYLSAAHFTFFLLSLRNWELPVGGLFRRFVAWYSIARLSIETIRVHKSAYYFHGVSVFQMILVCMALVSLYQILREKRDSDSPGTGSIGGWLCLAPAWAGAAVTIAAGSIVFFGNPSLGAPSVEIQDSGSSLSSVEPGTASKVRVAVLPFANRTETETAIARIWDETVIFFQGKGFEVIDQGKIRQVMKSRRIFPNTVITDTEVRALAGELKAELVVRGVIEDYGSHRKFRPAALLGIGVVLYGTVKVSARIISVDDGVFWDKTFSHTKKRQVLGVLQAHRLVMNEAVERVVRGLFEPFALSYRLW